MKTLNIDEQCQNALVVNDTILAYGVESIWLELANGDTCQIIANYFKRKALYALNGSEPDVYRLTGDMKTPLENTKTNEEQFL